MVRLLGSLTVKNGDLALSLDGTVSAPAALPFNIYVVSHVQMSDLKTRSLENIFCNNPLKSKGSFPQNNNFISQMKD